MEVNGGSPSTLQVSVETAECCQEEEELLTKLLEQNKLLEKDTRFTTRITSASTPKLPGTALSTSDPSLRSHDQASYTVSPEDASLTKSMPVATNAPSNDVMQNGSPKMSLTVLAATPNETSPNNDSVQDFPCQTHDETKETLSSPPSSCSSPLALPYNDSEVRSKPLPFSYIDNEAAPASDEDNEGNWNGQGPKMIVEGVGVLSQDQNKVDSDPKTMHSSLSSFPKASSLFPDGEGENQDVLSELPASSLVKVPRPRCDTESRSGKISLPFKGRKRSHTIQNGDLAKSKEEHEEKPLSAEETQWQQWSELMKNWDDMSKNSKLVRQLARQGVPEHLRGMAWQVLSDSIIPDLKENYPRLITESSPHERAIKRDLNRTFPEHSFFKERDGLGQESLLNVLMAYSVYDKEVGYCQGSPFIVGLLLMQMPEEEAFCVMVSLMTKYQLRDLYKPSMTDLSLCFYQLEKLIEEMLPTLSMHFKAVGFQSSMYASPWFLTMFASVLSLNVAFRVMDLLLVEGKDILFKVGLALLDVSQDVLIKMDMEEMIKYFQKEMRSLHEADPEQLISKVVKIKLHSKRMKKFSKDYLDKKARKVLEISEMTRLQNENMEMNVKLSKVHQECESLAQQLISGRIERAQEMEEMLQLRRELAISRKRLEERDRPISVLGHDGNMKVPTQDRGETGMVPMWEGPSSSGHGNDFKQVAKMHQENENRLKRSSSLPHFPNEAGIYDASGNLALSSPNVCSLDVYKKRSSSPYVSPFVHRDHIAGSLLNFYREEEPPELSPVPLQSLGSPSLSEDLEDQVKKKKRKRKLMGRSKSARKFRGDFVKLYDLEPAIATPSQLWDGGGGDKEGTMKKNKKKDKKEKKCATIRIKELEEELVLAKTHCADYANQLVDKVWEYKKVLDREDLLVREVKEFKVHLSLLQAKLSKVNSTDLCSQCWSRIAMEGEEPPSYLPLPFSATPQDAGHLPTQTLMTNIRAILKPHNAKKEQT